MARSGTCKAKLWRGSELNPSGVLRLRLKANRGKMREGLLLVCITQTLGPVPIERHLYKCSSENRIVQRINRLLRPHVFWIGCILQVCLCNKSPTSVSRWETNCKGSVAVQIITRASAIARRVFRMGTARFHIHIGWPCVTMHTLVVMHHTLMVSHLECLSSRL